MTTLRGITKIFFFFVIISVYLLVSFVGQLFLRNISTRQHFFTYLANGICRVGIWYLNIKLIVKNLPPADQNFLFVGNHVGIVDIIVLGSLRPSLFITSVEMKQTPGLGLLCEMGGCLFVERRNRAGIPKEIQQIREALKNKVSVVLYPEGTSTDGSLVLPFKKSMLTAAAGTGVPIMPLVINYRMVNGEPMSDKVRDYVCWYGDQPFTDAFWRLMTMKSCVAEIEFLSEIDVHSDEQRREIAKSAHDQITAKFTPIIRPTVNS